MANLDTAQLELLRTDVTVTHANELWPAIVGGVEVFQTILEWWNVNNMIAIADFYSQEADPVVSLWRPNLTNDEVSGVLVWTEVLTLSSVELQVFNLLLNGPESLVDATLSTVRAGFSDIFSGPQRATTLNALTNLARQNATYGEAVFIGGIQSGSYVSAIFGQAVNAANLTQAKALP